MWLKIFYGEENIPKWWSKEKCTIHVSLEFALTAPISDNAFTFRLSPIFPLVEDSSIRAIDSTIITFFNYINAYRVLGRLNQLGSAELKNCVFFSCGLSSILLITNDGTLLKEFDEIVNVPPSAKEVWIIKNSLIEDITYELAPPKAEETRTIDVIDYSSLELTERAIIDEFKISVTLLLKKMRMHMPDELIKIEKLVDEINQLIKELVYLGTLDGSPPDTIGEFDRNDLENKKNSNIIRYQNLDRIIQVNSALGYVSTQAFSGAIPILERRSLVRRNSLLGIGSAILALNNVARFIENCFAKVDFEQLIVHDMANAAPLSGLDNIDDYDCSTWQDSSISVFKQPKDPHNSYFKLPYFNGRLGFRETEYSIAAAIQSISSGASLEWSLMTVTHEMLHGHVRDIMKFIFYGGDKLKDEQQRSQFYESFKLKVKNKKPTEKLIDSIRTIIFTYCCFSMTHGSITDRKEYKAELPIKLPEKKVLWNIFERENRNINEIFVHILDLHYFYASRISVYIPLIWCSWAAVPYITGDVRQYILRSILTICSKTEGTIFERFTMSVSRLKELLEKYQDTKLNHSIIKEVIATLNDENDLMKFYFPAFNTSIIIVDMIDKIFTSEKIRGNIFSDEFVMWENEEQIEDGFEKIFKYNISDGFNDDVIKSPVSYLLNKMINELNSKSGIKDLERETTIEFLALNSN